MNPDNLDEEMVPNMATFPPAPTPGERLIDTGGDAFPTTNMGRHGEEYGDGMTLRDWFAGQFVAGNASQYCNEEDAEHGATLAYQWADALIARRYQ